MSKLSSLLSLWITRDAVNLSYSRAHGTVVTKKASLPHSVVFDGKEAVPLNVRLCLGIVEGWSI